MEREIHEVEDSIYRMLLRLGRLLLEIFVLSMGTGKVGRTLVASDGSEYRYVGTCPRRYLAIFGEITNVRAHYAKHGRAGAFPLDARLNLPEPKYSHVLQDWLSSKATESSFESVSAWARRYLVLKVAHRPVQRVVRDCTEEVEEFMESLPAPPREEEGSVLVHTVDCKGISMHPSDRNKAAVKTEEKPGEKRMACVARGYSVDPHVRSPETIVKSFFKNSGSDMEKQFSRPKPRHLL